MHYIELGVVGPGKGQSMLQYIGSIETEVRGIENGADHEASYRRAWLASPELSQNCDSLLTPWGTCPVATTSRAFSQCPA
ncbi:hypothetical protein D3C80_2028110 [compost metagenome]